MVLVPARLFRVLLFAVGFQRGIDLLSQRLHLTRVRQAFGVWNSRRCIAKLCFGVGTVPSCSRTPSKCKAFKQNNAAARPLMELNQFLQNTELFKIRNGSWFPTLILPQLNLVLWKMLLRGSNWENKSCLFFPLYKVKGTEERHVLGESVLLH